MNLFRAQKNSERAKVYRGGVRRPGSYKNMAYSREEWAITNACTVLAQHAGRAGMQHRWQRDPATPGYEWDLYDDIPTGQIRRRRQPGARGARATRVVVRELLGVVDER